MQGGDATATGAIFAHERVALGYATARPYLHPEIFEGVRAQLGLSGKVARALDVGCGTGLSSVALGALAGEVVGTDASAPMLRHARASKRRPGATSRPRAPLRRWSTPDS
jgi:SAM-dependent methyltransferase